MSNGTRRNIGQNCITSKRVENANFDLANCQLYDDNLPRHLIVRSHAATVQLVKRRMADMILTEVSRSTRHNRRWLQWPIHAVSYLSIFSRLWTRSDRARRLAVPRVQRSNRAR
jgi:hypothetical protein